MYVFTGGIYKKCMFLQVASMTTQQFILEVEPNEWTQFTYKIKAERSSHLETVLISGVRNCYDTGN
jgi:hypothetical protein